MSLAIKSARLKRGQTLVQVAKAIGTDAGNLSRVENGKQMPSPKMAAKLARYFGYEITEIQILYPERFAESPQQPG
jgi:putative transcriptional regulator